MNGLRDMSDEFVWLHTREKYFSKKAKECQKIKLSSEINYESIKGKDKEIHK